MLDKDDSASTLPPNLVWARGLDREAQDFKVSDKAAMRALARAEEEHFWHRSRNELIEGRLRRLGVAPPARILELGCGGGCVLRHLSCRGYRLTGIDGHAELATLAARRAPGARIFVHDLASGLPSTLGAEPFDVVALFDVIEHLDDPVQALRTALERAREGGLVVGTVPALMALWSAVDEAAGHKRRYSHDSLKSDLTRVEGAVVEEIVPFNRLLVPALWLQRRLVSRSSAESVSVNNLRVPAEPVNAALYYAARAEQRLAPALEWARVPGSSLWFVLRKRAGSTTCGSTRT